MNATCDPSAEALTVRDKLAPHLAGIGVHATRLRAARAGRCSRCSGKAPAVAGGKGVLDATTAVGQVIAWWTSVQERQHRRPGARQRDGARRRPAPRRTGIACPAGEHPRAAAADAVHVLGARRRRPASVLTASRGFGCPRPVWAGYRRQNLKRLHGFGAAVHPDTGMCVHAGFRHPDRPAPRLAAGLAVSAAAGVGADGGGASAAVFAALPGEPRPGRTAGPTQHHPVRGASGCRGRRRAWTRSPRS